MMVYVLVVTVSCAMTKMSTCVLLGAADRLITWEVPITPLMETVALASAFVAVTVTLSTVLVTSTV